MHPLCPPSLRALGFLALLGLAQDALAQPRRRPRARPRRPVVVATPAPPAPSVPPPTTPSTAAPALPWSGSFPVRAGQFTATLRVNNEAREVALVVPARRAPNPPLVLFFHGTNGNGAGILEEGAVARVAEAHGVVVAAPTSRWLPDGDWDHPNGAETYWDTTHQDPARNPDLVLVRAVLESSAQAYHHDPARVYVAGHSNGAFFALTVAMLFREEIAAFAENSGGLNRCRTTPSCRFRGRGTTCEALAAQRGWCACDGPALPLPVATSGRRPAAWLQHGTDDNMVSVQYTCDLATALRGAGYEVQVRLTDGEGHYLPESFFRDAWPFFEAHRR